MWMRGGTSKGGYFLADDLPQEESARDAFLLSVMGSPDPRQIDGMGGADPLTSKVAVVKKSARPGVDVDYLFLQVFVDRPVVTDSQNCGNILAGVGPFAIERGLVAANDGRDRGAHLHGKHRPGRGRDHRDAGRPRRICRRRQDRRRAGHSRRDPDRVRGHGRFHLRRAAADRQCGRRRSTASK